MIFWTTVNQVPCVYEALIPALQNVRITYVNGSGDSVVLMVSVNAVRRRHREFGHPAAERCARVHTRCGYGCRAASSRCPGYRPEIRREPCP